MVIVIFLAYLFFGVMAFSQILLPLLYALPKYIRLQKEGKLKKQIPISTFIVPAIIWSAIVYGSVLFVETIWPKHIDTYYLALTGGFFIVLLQIFIKNPGLEIDFLSTWRHYLKEEALDKVMFELNNQESQSYYLNKKLEESIFKEPESIRKTERKKDSDYLISYKLPIGFKVYYPSDCVILKDNLVNNFEKYYSDEMRDSVIFCAFNQHDEIIVEVFRNPGVEFNYFLLTKKWRDLFVDILKARYNITENEINEKNLTEWFIRFQIDDFLESLTKSSLDKFTKEIRHYVNEYSGISQSKVIKAKKLGDNAVIWIEKLKLKTDSPSFIPKVQTFTRIRVGKYLIYHNGETLYVLTMNIISPPNLFMQKQNLIKKCIIKSGFYDFSNNRLNKYSSGVIHNSLDPSEIVKTTVIPTLIYCSNCKKANPYANNYCTNCGAKLIKETQ